MSDCCSCHINPPCDFCVSQPDPDAEPELDLSPGTILQVIRKPGESDADFEARIQAKRDALIHKPTCDMIVGGGLRICDCGAFGEEETRLFDSDTAAGYEGQGSD